MQRIKVIISDFQFLTREGLKNLLSTQPDIDVLGCVDSSIDLLTNIIDQKPDVLIVDAVKQDHLLFSSLRRIQDLNACQILVVTNEDEKAHIQSLLDIGIKAIVTKNCSKHEIINAIYSVAQQNRFFCHRILEIVMSSSKTAEEFVNCDAYDLSPREFEVLKLIVKGHKTISIADQLNVSVHTINSHRKSILKKLNIKSPAELIVFAIESGIMKTAV